jgi:hypothetical protein
MNNSWNQWVLNYTPQRQRGLIDQASASLLHWPAIGALAGLCALLFVVVTLRRRARKDPVDALYSALSLQLGRYGVARRLDEGPSAWAARLSKSDLPTRKMSAATRFLQLYSHYKYARAPAPSRAAAVRELRHQLKTCLHEIR